MPWPTPILDRHAPGVSRISFPATRRYARAGRANSFEPAIAKAFGGVIRAERESRKIAQDAFALMAGIDRSYYGKLERGERQPSLGLLLRIATGLDVSAATLIRRTESVLASVRSADAKR